MSGLVGRRRPACALALSGWDRASFDEAVGGQRLSATPVDVVRGNPEGSAGAALMRLEATARRLVRHLDVDVLDTGLFPLANFPHFSGLTLDEGRRCLTTFARSDRLAAMVVTEVNPDHDPDGRLLVALVDVLADTVATVPDETTRRREGRRGGGGTS